jgi:hypothetical protein
MTKPYWRVVRDLEPGGGPIYLVMNEKDEYPFGIMFEYDSREEAQLDADKANGEIK